MAKKSYKKILVIIIITLIIFNLSGSINNVYAEINKHYSSGDTVGSIDVNRAVSGSTLLDHVAHFIYAIAGFVEKIISSIIGGFSGVNTFPWADKVIFNTVRFLDVNFISPSKGSMFLGMDGKYTIFGNIVSNMYYTIFILSLAFFGVVVGVMAVKLAISSIASEKAKYKQAITNWLFALILLFTSHYLISFIFFVNEKMVEIASTLVKSNLENVDFKEISEGIETYNDEDLETALGRIRNAIAESTLEIQDVYPDKYDDEAIDTFLYSQKLNLVLHFLSQNVGANVTEEVNKSEGETPQACMLYKGSKYTAQEDFRFSKEELQTNLDLKDATNITTNHTSFEINKKASSIFNKYVLLLMADEDFVKSIKISGGTGNRGWSFGENLDDFTLLLEAALLTINDNELITYIYGDNTNKKITSINQLIEEIKNIINNSKIKHDYDAYGSGVEAEEVHKAAANVWAKRNGFKDEIEDEKEDTKNQEVIGSIGTYFKNASYTYKRDSTTGKLTDFTGKKDKFQPVNAILYAIFIIQSMMYFIAYLKRFFYIIVLALFSPMVILYDLLAKTTKS